MFRLLVFYATPADPVEFDRRYQEEHVPLTWRIPSLRGFGVSRGAVTSTREPAPYLVANLEFASAQEAQAALASDEATAATAHAAEIATGGMWVVSYDETPVPAPAPA